MKNDFLMIQSNSSYCNSFEKLELEEFPLKNGVYSLSGCQKGILVRLSNDLAYIQKYCT